MGSLPQHNATEFRRYMNRVLPLFPDLSAMTHILRTPFNQYQAKALFGALKVFLCQ
jgi:oleate hydratase